MEDKLLIEKLSFFLIKKILLISLLVFLFLSIFIFYSYIIFPINEEQITEKYILETDNTSYQRVIDEWGKKTKEKNLPGDVFSPISR